MLQKIRGDGCAHGVQYDVNTFAAGKLNGRDEVCVSGDQHDLIHLVLVRHCRDIQSKPHIDALLNYIEFEILIARRMAFAPAMNGIRPQPPWRQILVQSAKPQRDLSCLVKTVMNGEPKLRLRRLRQIDGAFIDRRVKPFGKRRAVVKKDAV